jgi:hypothetical protein
MAYPRKDAILVGVGRGAEGVGAVDDDGSWFVWCGPIGRSDRHDDEGATTAPQPTEFEPHACEIQGQITVSVCHSF